PKQDYIERVKEDCRAVRLVQKTLDRLIEYCDEIQKILLNKATSPNARIEAVRGHAVTLPEGFEPIPARKFKVRVRATRGPEAELDVRKRGNRGRTEIPSGEELFRLPHLEIHADQKPFWDFWEGITQLDDYRRLRRCSNGFGHDLEPYYFLTKRVQLQEKYFCSDSCRSQYNYRKE